MKRTYAVIVLVIYICNIFLTISLGAKYCFQFTWPGPSNKTVNCTNDIPCVKPFYNSFSPPKTNEMWAENPNKYSCELNTDNVCIKYTYTYNNAVVNASYFCGKVIEDQTSAITSGCYVQHTEGYTIEVCACQSTSNANDPPCNATTRNTYSILITIGATAVTLFVYKIFYIL
ncbi:uncharacterized protein LOC116850090 [Odontomachus brunneus]|uniref:uncharacterized protein LOC116850090 n=1 Tax=Odontomachus brunneus TaxID=486640 RepID=UPI0013F22132|nr:uncharacterized protein LOC116850090 [Odontomachus brunneus]